MADGTLGTLLQGVSQQPPAVRPSGKVTEQINLISDVEQGLTSRPGLMERAINSVADPDTWSFYDFSIGDKNYVMAATFRRMLLWDEFGVEQTVLAPNDAMNYMGRFMRPYVYEDQVFLANRNMEIKTHTVPNPGPVLTNAGIIHCLGGLFDRTYKARVRYGDGGWIEAVYTTPDGTNDGDSTRTSAEYIAQQLYIGLRDSPGITASMSLKHENGVIGITDSNLSFTVRLSDGDDGSSLKGFTFSARGVGDLPETGMHGHVVRIINNDEGNEDDYYLRFKSDVTDTLGEGLGSPGVWEEWYNPHHIRNYDRATMPHVLSKNEDGTFLLAKGDWLPRRVGDEKSNPFLDLVGYSVRDIAGFQSRLVMTAGPYCIMSRTNEPLDLFKSSAIVDVETDPISVASTEEGTTSLDWIIPFDRDLILMSDPGKGQYIITGAVKITPDNASIVKTTSFEMEGGAKPIETGKTIMFPFKSGKYSGIQEFFTNDSVATNGADTVTATVDRYIVGLVNHMQVSTNFNFALFKTDSPEHENIVWVYKYLWQGNEKVQSSWSKWELPYKVEHFHFSGSEIVFVMSYMQEGEQHFIWLALDLDIPDNALAGYNICLDRQRTINVDVGGSVTLPFPDAAFIQGAGCASPGRQLSVSHVEQVQPHLWAYHFTKAAPEGAEVVCGLRYTRKLIPTIPFLRDGSGKPITRGKLVVQSYLVHYENTGFFRSIMESKYRSQPTVIDFDWFPLDNDAEDLEGNGLRSGILSVPCGERAIWSTWTLCSDDMRPTTILEIEWVGQARKGGR